jgi:hypothetical protein
MAIRVTETEKIAYPPGRTVLRCASDWKTEYSPKAAIGFAELLDQGRRSSFQKALLVLLSLAVVLDGLNNQVIGFALSAILKDGAASGPSSRRWSLEGLSAWPWVPSSAAWAATVGAANPA